ncbi:MAG: hypothetical protein SangKO_070140 [Sandaracinaceae bacterium]
MGLALGYSVEVLLADGHGAGQLALTALCGADHPPDYWGPVPGVRRSMNVAEVRACLDQLPHPDLLPTLHRTSRPRYRCTLGVAAAPTPWIRLESQLRLADEDRRAYYDLATTLARALPIEFGLVRPSLSPAAEMVSDAPSYQGPYPPTWGAKGPHRVYSRTLIGRPLFERLPARMLADAGTVIVEESPELVVADALPSPWDADAQVLWDRVVDATRALRLHG